MRQLYKVGKWIRKTYSTTVGLNYSSTISFIRSSDSDRCIMSAQALLAGLYPPTVDQIFVPNLKWHPIPVHTVPRNMDKVCLNNLITYVNQTESRRKGVIMHTN